MYKILVHTYRPVFDITKKIFLLDDFLEFTLKGTEKYLKMPNWEHNPPPPYFEVN